MLFDPLLPFVVAFFTGVLTYQYVSTRAELRRHRDEMRREFERHRDEIRELQRERSGDPAAVRLLRAPAPESPAEEPKPVLVPPNPTAAGTSAEATSVAVPAIREQQRVDNTDLNALLEQAKG